MILLCCIFLFLTSLCVALRILSRRIKGVYIGWDDVWIFIALVFTLLSLGYRRCSVLTQLKFFIYGYVIADIVG